MFSLLCCCVNRVHCGQLENRELTFVASNKRAEIPANGHQPGSCNQVLTQSSITGIQRHRYCSRIPYIPSLNSKAALLIIRSLSSAPGDGGLPFSSLSSVKVSLWQRFKQNSISQKPDPHCTAVST